MPSSLPDPEKIQAALPHYRIVEVAGRGGMSVVYVVDHLVLGHRRALKVLSPELANDELFRRRFVRESRTLVQLDHHHIVPVYDAGVAGGFLYLVMRHVDGLDLRQLLKLEGVPSPAKTADIVAQLASALDAAHRTGLMHRDVKPANVLVDRKSGEIRCYLSDFGLAKPVRSDVRLTSSGMFLGTPVYASPEQIQGKSLNSRTDMYSLGCLVYECLTGRPPFVKENDLATMWAHLNDAPPPVREFNSELPAQLDPVLSRALAKDPDDRYPTCAEFSLRLTSVLQSGALIESAPEAAEAATSPMPLTPNLTKVRQPTGSEGRTQLTPSARSTSRRTASDRPVNRDPASRSPNRTSPAGQPFVFLAAIAVAVVVALTMWAQTLAGRGDDGKASGQGPLPPPSGPSMFLRSCSSQDLLAKNRIGDHLESAWPAEARLTLAQDKPSLVIGTLGDRTGINASSILPSHQGMQMAIEEANATGDLPVHLQFRPLDNRDGKAETAPGLAQQLIDDPAVVAVLGAGFSPEVAATGEMLSRAGLLNISALATRPSLSGSGFKTFFRAVPSDDVQGSAMMRMLAHLGCRQVAVISDDKVYSQGLASAAVREATALNMKVVIEQSMPPATEYRDLAQTLLSAEPQAVFYAGYAGEFALLAQALRSAGYGGLLTSGDGSHVPGIGRRIGVEAAEGILLSCPCPDVTRSSDPDAIRFVGSYSARFGDRPERFAAEGYDVANVAVEAIERCGSQGVQGITRECVVEKVREGGFEGITKNYDFAPNGEVRSGDVVLFAIRNGEVNPVGLVGELIGAGP